MTNTETKDSAASVRTSEGADDQSDGAQIIQLRRLAEEQQGRPRTGVIQRLGMQWAAFWLLALILLGLILATWLGVFSRA